MQDAARGVVSDAPAPPKLPASLSEQTVLSVQHWTDRLFSLTLTRDPGFRFENGQFAMIGLMVAGKPVLRAYSMASPNHHDTLEFLSIKVPDGPLTSHLQHVQVGDKVLVGRKPTGTLLLDNLQAGAHAVHVLDRHGDGAVPEPGRRSGAVCPVRARGAYPHLRGGRRSWPTPST